jgi:hypothetical protein
VFLLLPLLHVSAPKPPNNPVGLLHPKNSNDDKEDVPMRELTEETKEKKQPVVNESKKKQKNTENRVHWGENVVHNGRTTRTTTNTARDSRSRNRRWFGGRK